MIDARKFVRPEVGLRALNRLTQRGRVRPGSNSLA
jgi:hypothetical protein